MTILLTSCKLRPLDLHLLDLMRRDPDGITVAGARSYLATEYRYTLQRLDHLVRHGLARKVRSREGRALYVLS